MRSSNPSPTVANFKTGGLTHDELRAAAPSVFSPNPMSGLSARYAFLPTIEIIQTLSDRGWVPVDVEQQRVRLAARSGFQKHLVRFRREEQMRTLDEWNAELVLVNSHDALSAYILRVGVFRRICSNGLVVSDRTFEAVRFRHAGLESDQVVQASQRIVDAIPRVTEMIDCFRNRHLREDECRRFSEQALALRFGSAEKAPIEPATLLQAQRPEDEGSDLWSTYNRVQENLVRGGLSDFRRDRRRRLRTLRALRGIDSRVSLNTDLWSLAEQFVAERN